MAPALNPEVQSAEWNYLMPPPMSRHAQTQGFPAVVLCVSDRRSARASAVLFIRTSPVWAKRLFGCRKYLACWLSRPCCRASSRPKTGTSCRAANVPTVGLVGDGRDPESRRVGRYAVVGEHSVMGSPAPRLVARSVRPVGLRGPRTIPGVERAACGPLRCGRPPPHQSVSSRRSEGSPFTASVTTSRQGSLVLSASVSVWRRRPSGRR